jgi:PAS domain S-box-containing protein
MKHRNNNGGFAGNGAIGKILVVDDEPELKAALVESLIDQGYEATGFSSGHDALVALGDENFDLLLTDLMMPEMDGIALLQAALEVDPNLVTLIMTGQGTIQTAVDAMKSGAFDYFLKPFRLQTLMPALTRAMNIRHLRLENVQLRDAAAIYELSQTIAFTLNPQTVLSKLADAALQQTQADEVSILLPSRNANEFHVAVARGKNRQRLLGERVPLEHSISSWVARERTPVILNGEVHDDRFATLWPRPDIRSSMSVPMQVANNLIGVVNVNLVSRPRPFTLGQMKALTILAGTAAAALESASLYTQVQKAEADYRSIFENAGEGIFRTTTDGKFITANPAMAEIMGYQSPSELMGAVSEVTRQLYVDPNKQIEWERRLQKGERVTGFEAQYRRMDGSLVWLSESAHAVRDQGGAVLYYEGIAEDITQRRLAEAEQARLTAEIREQRERLNTIVATVPGVVFEAWGRPDAADHRVDFVSDYIEVMLGYSVAEWLSTPRFWLSIVHPEDRERVERESALQFADRRDGEFEFRWVAKDKRIVWVGARTIIICAEDGTPVGVRGVVTDITERKQLEDQLRQSQKMEAIGQLAGGVAHDFNNLLTVINGYSSLALQRIDDNHPLRSYLEEIRKSGDRAANLTRQLLAFGRKQILQPLPINLNDIVTDMNKMLRRLIGEDVELTAKLDPALKKIRADPGQIESVLVNLVVNARDAMPQGGDLTIETAGVELDQEYASRHVSVLPGNYVMLAVSDTGTGMDEATRARIFDPFFTTKEKGKGTGLGLSTVYGIVKQSGGNIWVYSEEGHGTTFKVYLPRVDEPNDRSGDENGAKPMPRGTETVLLVEDDEQVRQIAQMMLETQGYDLLVAVNGEQALALAQQQEKNIDLMITDVVMPQMGGRELGELLSSSRPDMKVLYMSGYTDDAIVRHGLMDERLQFIEKPFTTDALARKVRQVLDAGANGRGRIV